MTKVRRISIKNVLWFAVALGLVLVAVYFWDKQKTLFPFKQVEVTPALSQLGSERQQQLKPVLNRYLGQSFWQVDLLQLQSELVRLEWVRSATVTRQWPDALLIKLMFQIPVARWNENGLINNAGQVFYPLDLTPYLNLVQLQGRDENAAEVLSHLVQFQQQLDKLRMKIQSLQLRDSGVWEVRLLSGKTLVMDREQALSRLERFVMAYPKVEKSYLKVAQGFDLRYSNGFIVKKKVTTQTQ